MSEQQYTYDGRPGCVMRHRSRATGTTIGIYKADQAGLDGSAGEWIAICEEHGERYGFPNLRHARAHYATAPWCGQCHPAGAPGVPVPTLTKRRSAPRVSYVSISGDQTILLNMRLYEHLGRPPSVRIEWVERSQQLMITPVEDGDVNTANVYPVQASRRTNGSPYRTGAVHAMAAIRAAGLTPGRYQPKVKGDQVVLKASYKIVDAADGQPGEAAGDPMVEAQD